MKKRDRYVRILLHRKTSAVLLFPFVCYMAGHAAGYGNVRVLTAKDRSKIGKACLAMFTAGRKANVDRVAQARTDALHRKWRGENVSPEETHPGFAKKTNYKEVLAQFPVLTRGMGAYHQTFVVAQLVERDGWTSRRLVHLVRSSFASSESDAETLRLPVVLGAKELGEAVIEQIIAWQSKQR